MVPGLDEVVHKLPVTELPALIGELERAKMEALARVMNERGIATTQDDDVLTVPEVALRLKISVYRAYQLTRQGVLKTIRIGRSVRVATKELNNYLAERGH